MSSVTKIFYIFNDFYIYIYSMPLSSCVRELSFVKTFLETIFLVYKVHIKI